MASRADEVSLASRSPRRRSLLDEHGFRVHIVDSGIDDSDLEPGRTTPERWVAALAYLKARAGAERLPAGAPRRVIGADTMCILEGRLVGQARDAAHAGAILRAFESREHGVITGVAVVDLDAGTRDIFTDRATVRVGEIDPVSMREYLASGAWRGKAGAYNLSERLAAGWPITFEGDWTTIVGLPMGRLVPLLQRVAA